MKNDQTGVSRKIIRKLFLVMPFAVQNSLALGNCAREVVGNVRFVRIQSIRFVNLLIVDAQGNIWKNWMQNFVYMRNQKNWSVFSFFLSFFCFCRLFWFFLVLFFKFLQFCILCKHYPWPILVFQRKNSVSNQHTTSDPFENQTLCISHCKR